MQIRFRPSMLGQLMTDPREKSPKQQYAEMREKIKEAKTKYEETANKETKTAINLKARIEKYEESLKDLEKGANSVFLSETCKSALTTMMIELRYKRRKRIETKQMKKGIECEEDAFDLFSSVKGVMYVNNTTRIVNDYLSGEYDTEETENGEIVKIIDMKNRFDIDTFFDSKKKMSKNDSSQLDGYMALIPTARKASIANCLVNNTIDAIYMELRKEEYKWNEGIVPQWRQVEIIKDSVYDHITFKDYVAKMVGRLTEEGANEMFDSFVEIPEKERVYEWEVERSGERIEAIYKRLDQCYEYLFDEWGLIDELWVIRKIYNLGKMGVMGKAAEIILDAKDYEEGAQFIDELKEQVKAGSNVVEEVAGDYLKYLKQ